MRSRQQGSTSYPVPFLLVSGTDHITGATGLTPTVTLSKNGAAFAAAAGAVSEIGNGWYALAGNATDRGTLGEMLIHAAAAGADPTDEPVSIVAFDPFAGPGLTLDGGTVAASPAPTSTAFGATMAFGEASTAYNPTATQTRSIMFLSGANHWVRRGITTYTLAGGVAAFTFAEAFPFAIAAGDTFAIL